MCWAECPGASEDGSYVYFVADGILENDREPVPGAVHGTCASGVYSPGAQCNLYLRHDGTTKLVAVLSGADEPDWGHEYGDTRRLDRACLARRRMAGVHVKPVVDGL